MAIEIDIESFLTIALPEADIYWGKIPTSSTFDDRPIISFIKPLALNNPDMPITNDNIQFTTRHKRVDTATLTSNKLKDLLLFKSGDFGSYQIWVVDVTDNGALYEEENIVAVIVTIAFKHIGI